MDALVTILKVCAFLAISWVIMYVVYKFITKIVFPIIAVVVPVIVFWVVVIVVICFSYAIYQTVNKPPVEKQKTEMVTPSTKGKIK